MMIPETTEKGFLLIRKLTQVICILLWVNGPLAPLIGQATLGQRSKLPQEAVVKDTERRTYRFTVTYNTANNKGDLLNRHRLTGDYTRGLERGEVVWDNVTQADAEGASASFGPEKKVEFMNGFRYHDDVANTFRPDFFKGFPPTAVFERNLIWDTSMIENFGQDFLPYLQLNQPHHILSNQNVSMPGVGSFHNRDVVLEWIGRSQRNGRDCVVITYSAFLNPLDIKDNGMTLQGLSNYWGEIWVSLASRQIEYATLRETVVGDLKLAGQSTSQLVNILRTGTFEPVAPEKTKNVQ